MRLIIGVLLLTIYSCAVDGQKPPDGDSETDFSVLEGWNAIIEEDYSIQYPDSFTLDDSGLMGSEFFLFSRQLSSTDMFRENLNLMVLDLPAEHMSLEEYGRLSEEQAASYFNDFEIMESEVIETENGEYYQIAYTGTQGRFLLRWLQKYWFMGGKAYTLSLTCEQDTYDNYGPVGEQIMATFTLSSE
ncbi:MAG: hypothetical protein AAF544_09855 [Bacteroidota bacterium]